MTAVQEEVAPAEPPAVIYLEEVFALFSEIDLLVGGLSLIVDQSRKDVHENFHLSFCAIVPIANG